jgi:ribosomal protein S18 acetylase RimI-like enzyme
MTLWRADAQLESGAMIGVRPATQDDEAFLRELYASTRTDELALVDWSDDQKAAFVRLQFAAQHRFYHAQFANAAFGVVLFNGDAVGRLDVARWPAEIRLIDMTLLPEYRNCGIGSLLIGQLLAEAARTGKRVSLHVARGNPASRLYTRLGFRAVADEGVYLLMEWARSAATSAVHPV